MIKDMTVRADVALHALTTTYEKFPIFSVISLAIPWLGLADRLISKTASTYEIGRLHFLLDELSNRVDNLEELPESESFYPAFTSAWDSIRKSQSREKVKYFASILATTWSSNSVPWDEITQIIRIVRDLEDLHILILREASELDPKKIFRINGNGNPKSIDLSEKFRDYESIVLDLCISDLISMGLMNDRVSSNGSTFGSDRDPMPSPPAGYSISATGRWLLGRIETMATEAETTSCK
jgi:hypothetical protein